MIQLGRAALINISESYISNIIDRKAGERSGITELAIYFQDGGFDTERPANLFRQGLYFVARTT